jgi:hypothetical protein
MNMDATDNERASLSRISVATEGTALSRSTSLKNPLVIPARPATASKVKFSRRRCSRKAAPTSCGGAVIAMAGSLSAEPLVRAARTRRVLPLFPLLFALESSALFALVIPGLPFIANTHRKIIDIDMIVNFGRLSGKEGLIRHGPSTY